MFHITVTLYGNDTFVFTHRTRASSLAQAIIEAEQRIEGQTLELITHVEATIIG